MIIVISTVAQTKIAGSYRYRANQYLYL